MGVSSLEILKKLLKDILNFAMDSGSLTDSLKVLKRKKMMYNLFEFMKQKVRFVNNVEEK